MSDQVTINIVESVDEVTIDVTESVDEVEVKVFEGGGIIELDPTVTEDSENAVESKGIWSWVKGLFVETKTDTAQPSLATRKLGDEWINPTTLKLYKVVLNEAAEKVWAQTSGGEGVQGEQGEQGEQARFESYFFNPTAGFEAFGDIVSVLDKTITTTANLTGLDLVGKVIRIADGTMEFCIIASHTNNTITVDCPFVNVITSAWAWQCWKTYILTSNNEQIIALYMGNAPAAVILPAVTAANDRNVIKVYVEVKNGYDAVVVAPQANKITSQFFNKWVTLESKNEVVELLPHLTSEPHFDIINQQFSQIIATTYWTANQALAATTAAQRIVLEANVANEFRKNFEIRVDINGFEYAVFTSLIPTIIEMKVTVNLTRGGGAAANVTGYWTLNDTPLNRVVTSRFATADTASMIITDVAELSYGDRIYPLLKRESAAGVYTLLQGSSIIVNKL